MQVSSVVAGKREVALTENLFKGRELGISKKNLQHSQCKQVYHLDSLQL